MTDRAFTICFAISLGVHLALLGGQLLPLNWLISPRAPSSIELIYEYEIAQQELRQLKEQLARTAREQGSAPTAAALNVRPQIRIPDRPLLITPRHLDQTMPIPSSVVDLTNLADAARGNPVLLSYFTAIREQIQQTANNREWLTGEAKPGLVFISFLLTSSGAVRGLDVVSDRSAPSPALRDIALRIVKTAAPFPPFPPSIPEPSKTVVVPIEFFFGS
jgi:TonB family protein